VLPSIVGSDVIAVLVVDARTSSDEQMQQRCACVFFSFLVYRSRWVSPPAYSTSPGSIVSDIAATLAATSLYETSLST
jgi:hypothetical protein